MSDESRIEEILVACRERRERGEFVDPEEMARSHPEIAPALRCRLAAMRLAERALAADGAVPGNDASATADGLDPAREPLTAERALGPWKLLREIGRGGQAVVYLAQDSRLPRKVALKVFGPGLVPSEPSLARFRREAEAASRLDHPGICAVHEAGIDDGSPWIAMRFVEGRTLASCIEESRPRAACGRATSSVGLPGPDDAARSDRDASLLRVIALGEKAARALHAAHEAGLLHRDVKPGNIMVTPDGDPVLLDFGLARDDEAGRTLTAAGALVGTPAYMAPEQLLPDEGRVDRRADVYALGVSLYECVTLRVPFDGPNREAIFRRVLSSDADPPRRWNPQIPRDLEIVLTTAIERDRERRYSTALDLAEDLRRVRNDEPIRARPMPAVVRAHRWARRRPALATAAAGFAAAVAVALGLAVHRGAERREAERRDAAARRTRAAALVRASIAEAAANPTGALLLAREGARLDRSPLVVSRLGDAIADSPGRAVVRDVDGFTHLDFAPTGDRFVTARNDGTARVCDLDGRVLLEIRPHGRRLLWAEFDAGGGRIVTASIDATARIWDAETGAELRSLRGHSGWVRRATWSPEGNRILTASNDGTARLWDARTGAQVAVLSSHEGWVLAAEFSPGADRIVTTGTDGTARIWDAAGAELRVMRGHTGGVTGAAFSDTGNHLVTASYDGTARVWETATGKEVAVLRHGAYVRGLDVDRRRGRIVTGSFDGTVRLWTWQGAPVAVLRGHKGNVMSVVSLSRGGLIASASEDHSVRVWTEDGRPVAVLPDHGAGVVHLRTSRDGALLGSLGRDGGCWIWDLGSAGARTGPAGGEATPAEPPEAPGPGTEAVDAPLGTDRYAEAVRNLLRLADQRCVRDFTRSERERYADLLGPENLTALEAHRTVDRLVPGTALVSELVERVRSEPGLSDELRAAALRVAAERCDDPERVRNVVLEVVRSPNRSPEDYGLAVRRMTKLPHPWFPDCAFEFVRALALYRAGLVQDALDTIREVEEYERGSRKGCVREDVALRAMCLRRLGRKEEAREALALMRTLTKRPSRELPEHVDAYVREAEDVAGAD